MKNLIIGLTFIVGTCAAVTVAVVVTGSGWWLVALLFAMPEIRTWSKPVPPPPAPPDWRLKAIEWLETSATIAEAEGVEPPERGTAFLRKLAEGLRTSITET